MALQLRRGTNADRVAVAGVLASGEMYYCTDTKILWVGDGSTAGGTEVGSSTPYTDLYNVKLWGAVGDGVADDTAAIQDAVDAAGVTGGTVMFPPGTYLLASPFVTISNAGPIVIAGDHAWLDGGDAADHAFVFDNVGSPTFERVEFRNLWFKGFTVRPIECSPFDSSSRPTIERIVVSGCRVEDSAYGFHFYCKIGSGLFEGNTFENLDNATTDGATTLFIGSKYDVDQAETKNIIVTGNYANNLRCTATSSSTHAIVIFGHTVVVNGNIVCDNQATGTTPEGGMGISVKAYNVNISDNVCINAGGADDGHIYVKGLGRGDGASGSNGGESYAIRICDNVVISTIEEAYNQSESGISVDGGSDGKDNIVISGNYVEGMRNHGIKVEGSGAHDDISIVDNQVYGTRRNYGIRYVSTGKRLTIRGNRVVGIGMDGSQTNPIGIRVDPVGALDVCEIVDNLVSDNALATGSGTVYGIFFRPSAGAVSKARIERNTVDMQTTRAQVGLYVSVTGTGTLASGRINDNAIYVTAGNTAQSVSGAGSLSVNGMMTASADDATPSVLGVTHLLLPANTGATAITQLDDAVAGQQVTLVWTSATNPSTISDAGNFNLSAAFTPTVDDTLTLFTVNGTAWREIARSQN